MSFIPVYDLEAMDEQQRQNYVRDLCKHIGVPPELNLVMLTYLDEKEGPCRLVAYAKRGAAEIIRNTRGISITNLESKEFGGSIVFTATAKDSTGRQEISSGSKWIHDLTGQDRDDAIMTAQTRACRRVTLQFVGAGILDESEVNPARTVQLKESNPVPPPPVPTVAPSSAPGKDVTELSPEAVAAAINGPQAMFDTQEAFKAAQDKMRADAIAQLNAGAQPAEPVKKTRKPRSPNKPKTVDMGPSAPAPQAAQEAAPPAPAAVVTPTPAPVAAVPQAAQEVAQPASAPGKPRLSAEQVKPYRQRLFQLVSNQLEPNGFAPKEGMGNSDKMRHLATMMFPEVHSMNELTVEQWETYLSRLETRMKTDGAAATIQYIEDAIGL